MGSSQHLLWPTLSVDELPLLGLLHFVIDVLMGNVNGLLLACVR